MSQRIAPTIRRCFPAILLFLLLASPLAGPAQTDSTDKLRKQIEGIQLVLAQCTNDSERVDWEARLNLLQRDLDSLTRRAVLDERDKRLAEQHRANLIYALRETLAGIDSDIFAPKRERAKANDDIRSLRQQRSDLSARLRKLQQNADRNAEDIAELDQIIRNVDEQIVARMLWRDVADLQIRLVQEAERIEKELDELPLNPRVTIRLILAKRHSLAEEEKKRRELAIRMDAVKEREEGIRESLDLAKEKFAQIGNQIEIIRKKERMLKNKQFVLPWFVAANEKQLKDLINQRIAHHEDQLQAVASMRNTGARLAELYDRQIAVLQQYLGEMVRKYWTAILFPLTAIIFIIVISLILSRKVLPRFFEKDRLFIARRLTGYTAALLMVLVVALFFFEDLKAIATVLGIATAALVIALQDLCSSFAGWFVIVASRKVKVGDRVEIDGHCGDVIDIQLLRTTLLELNNWLDVDEPTGRVMVIPNSFIFKSKLFNYSHVHPYVWSRVSITVTFETPAQEAFETLRTILEEETKDEFEAAKNAPEEMARVYGVPDTVYQPKISSIIADSGVQFNLIYISHYRRRIATRNRLNDRIVAEFDKNPRLNFAYPTERHIPTSAKGDLHVTMDKET